jgi:murein DD-endopeptidase MepM/ murein hydrolase activator NlpD
MKKKDDRFYKIVVTRSNQDFSQTREIKISKNRLRAVVVFAAMTVSFISYTFFDLARDASNSHLSAQELLKQSSQNQCNPRELAALRERVETVEKTTLQYLPQSQQSLNGEGGPESYFDSTSEFNNNLYDKIRALEELLNNRANVPSIFPLIGKINNEFGWRRNPFGGGASEHHAGMDIDGNKGDPVIAPAEGVVIKAGWSGGYGNLIEISHGNDLTTRYGHLSQLEIEVGDTVTRGQQIGRVGSTGRSTGPHLHYEVRIGDAPVNPRDYLPSEPTAAVAQQ